jgi:hypothetical protein
MGVAVASRLAAAVAKKRGTRKNRGQEEKWILGRGRGGGGGASARLATAADEPYNKNFRKKKGTRRRWKLGRGRGGRGDESKRREERRRRDAAAWCLRGRERGR